MVIPTRPDGSYFQFEMIADGGWSRFYDDDPDGLVDFLIPGYRVLDADSRVAARVRHAVDLQVRLQARLNGFFAEVYRTAEEEAVLTGPRHVPPAAQGWACEVPLVVVDAFYAPYSGLPTPYSAVADVAMPPNLWWLRPAGGDLEYLRSLHEASLIDLHTAQG